MSFTPGAKVLGNAMVDYDCSHIEPLIYVSIHRRNSGAADPLICCNGRFSNISATGAGVKKKMKNELAFTLKKYKKLIKIVPLDRLAECWDMRGLQTRAHSFIKDATNIPHKCAPGFSHLKTVKITGKYSFVSHFGELADHFITTYLKQILLADFPIARHFKDTILDKQIFIGLNVAFKDS